MKLALIAAELLIAGPALAHALDSPMVATPQQPITQQAQMPAFACNPPGHPHAVCFWQDPGAQECYPDLLGGPKGYPARHYFDGRTVCWAGDQRFFAVVKP